MKLIHRYEVQVMSGRPGYEHEQLSTIVTSFYRPYLDSGYQRMIVEMLEYGRFNEFIHDMIGTALTTGTKKFLRYKIISSRQIFSVIS